MTRTQCLRLNRLFAEIIKNNIAWKKSIDIAAIFGGQRVGPDILVSLHNGCRRNLCWN